MINLSNISSCTDLSKIFSNIFLDIPLPVSVNETCKQLFQKYLQVEDKIRSGVQIIKPGQSYKITISSRDFDLSRELRNKLTGHLELLPTEDLFKIYTDQSLGAEAREIIRNRRNLNQL